VTLLAEAITTYGERRERARELGARLAFAQEPLRLYLALVDAQERAFERALATHPAADELAEFVVRDALPLVMEAAVAAGPESLREAVLTRFHDGDLEGIVEAWLSDDEQSGTDTFLARASASPVLEALPDLAATLVPRPLLIVDPRDAAGAPLDTPAFHTALNSYRAANASASYRYAERLDGTPDDAIARWLEAVAAR